MKKQLLILILIAFSFSVTAQTKEAIKFDVLSDRLTCSDFIARMDGIYSEYKKLNDAKIYVVYYEGKHEVYNRTKVLNPQKGDALNRAKEIPLYLTKSDFRAFKLPEEKIVLVNGGYREKFTLEIWLVPQNAELPKLAPTLEEKDIKFRKGKPLSVRDYGECTP